MRLAVLTACAAILSVSGGAIAQETNTPSEVAKPSPELEAAETAITDANRLYEARKYVQADAGFAKLSSRYAQATDPEFQRIAVIAIVGRARIASVTGKNVEALALIDEAIALLPTLQTDDTPAWLANAMLIRLGTLIALKRFDVADEQAQTAFDMFNDEEDPLIEQALAMTIGMRTAMSLENGNKAKARGQLQVFSSRFGKSHDREIQKMLLDAYAMVAFQLDADGDLQGAERTYAEAVSLAEKQEDPDGELVARSIVARGKILEKLKRDEDALAALQQAVSWFPSPKEPPIIGQVALSHNLRAGLFAKQGKADEAIAELRGVLALGRNINVDMILNDPNFRPLLNNARFVSFVRANIRR